MGDVLAALIVSGLVTFVALGLAYALRRPIAVGWRALRRVGLRRPVVVAALLTIAWLGAYPPWSYTFSGPGASQVVRAGPRAFILSPPDPEANGIRNGVTVDLARLLIEWIIVGAIAAALAGLLPPPRPRPRVVVSTEARDDGAEAGESEIDEPGKHGSPPRGRGGSVGRESDDPVAWSTRARGKATTPVEERMEFSRIDEAVRAAAIAPPPVTKSCSGRKMSDAEFKGLADQLAEGMARTLRERTLAEARADSSQSADAPPSTPAPGNARPSPRSWVVRKIKEMDRVKRKLD